MKDVFFAGIAIKLKSVVNREQKNKNCLLSGIYHTGDRSKLCPAFIFNFSQYVSNFSWKDCPDPHLLLFHAASGRSVLCKIRGQDRISHMRCCLRNMRCHRAYRSCCFAGSVTESLWGNPDQCHPICNRKRTDRGTLQSDH